LKYNPLDKKNLGSSVRSALLARSVRPMSDLLLKRANRYVNKFLGAGIYAIYYTGYFSSYQAVAEQNRDGRFDAPIYVGKAVPEGSRKGGLIDLDKTEKTEALFERLKIHANSIDEVTNLDLADFHFRYLEVDDIWIPLGETYMIHGFQPVWNKVAAGFGIKTPGGRRKQQYMSLWDTLHPGRRFVTALGLPPNPKEPEAKIRGDVERFLALPVEEKAKVAVKDDGSDGEEP
jgi:hypothetical protein